MTETAPKRGRKPTGKALTNAERQRRYIERLKAKAEIPASGGKQPELKDARLQIETQRAIIGTLENQRDAATQKAATQAESHRRELSAITKDRDALEARLKAVSDELEQARAREQEARREATLAAHERDVARAKLATLANGVSDGKEPSADSLSDRDRRILELPELSEIKVAAILKAEGIKCSARTVGNVRRRHSIA